MPVIHDTISHDWAITLHYFPDEKDIVQQIEESRDGSVKQATQHGFIIAQLTNDDATSLRNDERVNRVDPYNWFHSLA